MIYNFDIQVNYIEKNDDEIYRKQLLQVFNLEEYNDSIIEKITKVYNLIKENESFKKIINNVSNKHGFNKQTHEDIFIILFSYDYFETFHKVLCQLNENGSIDENIEKMFENLTNN